LNERGELSTQSGAREIPLPIGSITLDIAEQEFVWAGHRLSNPLPASNYNVAGIRNRYRRPGIGAALSAAIGQRVVADATPAERFTPNLRVPTTLVVQIQSPRAGLLSGKLRAHGQLFSPDEGAT